ncbi:MAG: putative FAD-linked oxidoreductase [Chloroflexi bacterium]|nr:putative FAD-linked oxidoreductase [Chloroflexota bacterium]
MVRKSEQLADLLERVLGSSKVLRDQATTHRYRGIAWGPASSPLPLVVPLAPAAVVVRPESADDVVATVRIAREAGAPIVPYGSGTGVHAGAAPVQGCVVLDLGAMNRIIRISREDRTARVGPGVVLGDLDREVGAHGLMVGHDPWSQPIASIGGAVSTNGVGYLAGKYGSMGDQVLGLEVVLGDGSLIRARAVPKTSTGPSLRHLFIGAEGVFGAITEVDVRLFPIPERRALVGYRVDRFEDGLEAVMDMVALQLRPSMIDYEEDDAAEGVLRVGSLVDVPSSMFLAFDGFAEEVDAQVRRADEICRQRGCDPMAEGAAQEFWDTRHASAERYLRDRAADPDGLVRRSWSRRSSTYLNVTLSPSTILEFRARAARELAPYHLAVKNAGVWGIPELVSVRLAHLAADASTVEADLVAGSDLVLRIAQQLGGSMEYCHGVGVQLAHLMGEEHGAALDALRRLKRSVDPDGIMNPGKLGL